MYMWVQKRKTPARKELDPKSKQIECIHGYTRAKHLQEVTQTQKSSKQNVYVGIEAQNTYKKGVRPKKQANKMYTWVYNSKTPARRELDPKSKQINVNVGIKAQNTSKKGVRPQKQANRMYKWVYKRKTPTRSELDP